MEDRKEGDRRDLAKLLDLIFGQFGGRLKYFKQRNLQLYGHWVSEGKENFTLDQFTGSCGPVQNSATLYRCSTPYVRDL